MTLTPRPTPRPALLLIDTAYLEPGDAAAHAALLLDAARAQGVPVLHSGLAFRADGLDGGHWFRRNPDLAAFAGVPVAHGPGLEPTAGEVVVARTTPSAFFGTSLAASLRGLDVNTVIVAGARASEGVHATVVDALASGFLPIVVADAVADRSDEERVAALRTLAPRYADEALTSDVLGSHLAPSWSETAPTR
jgi:maleamate amidohydrolase